MMRQCSTALVLGFFWVASIAAELPNFTQLIEKNSPAVVKINTVERTSLRRGQQLPPDMPDIFRDFFEQRRMPQRKAYSMGSGFIISRDGYILTMLGVLFERDETDPDSSPQGAIESV